MATFTDIANEIIAETQLDDIATVVYTYLYDSVKAICGLKPDWPFLEMNAWFQPDVNIGAYLMSNFASPVRNIQQFKILDNGHDSIGGAVYAGTSKWSYPDYVDYPDFVRFYLNPYGGNLVVQTGTPVIYTVGPVEATGPSVEAIQFRPYTNKAYYMSLTYFAEHPTGAGTTILVPNTELVKAAVKMRIYGDRGNTAGVEAQTVAYQSGLRDLHTRYGGIKTRGVIRVKRYF